MQHYYDDGNFGGLPEIAILMNMESGPVSFELPGGRDWGVVIDTQAYYDLPGRSGEATGWFDENPDADAFQSRNIQLDDPTIVSGSYEVPANTIIVLEQQL